MKTLFRNSDCRFRIVNFWCRGSFLPSLIFISFLLNPFISNAQIFSESDMETCGTKFQIAIDEELESEQMFSKVEELYNSAIKNQNQEAESIQDAYNDIAKKSYKICQQFGEKIRKVKHGGISWSPEIRKLRLSINCWKRIVKNKLGVMTSKTMINCLTKTCEITG